ncbi:MAG: type II toxin-antitoxin system RelE/ParE family toxin [Candidatus Binatia bacterium]
MRRYPVSLSDASHQILRHLHPDIKRSVRKALDDLSRSPYLGKPLKEELEGLWSLPVSRHRIIYQIEKRVVAVVFIGPRKDVYERLREILAEK